MKKRLFTFVLLAVLMLQTPLVAQAANTVFMVPEISATWDPPGMLYKSSNLDVLAYKGPPGVVADIINNRGLVAALTDLNGNVSPTNYGSSVLGIYPEGEALTDEIMQIIADAGWTKVEVYYPTFLLSGDPNCGGMIPVVEKTENEDLNGVLASAGYTSQVAVFKVEDVTFSDPGLILYEPDFSFLRGGTCTMYKYIPDIQKFVSGPTAMYDGYDRNFMDIENLPSADGEVNGIYVVVTQPLPAELVIATAEIQPLREQLEAEDTQISTGTQMSGNASTANDSKTKEQNDDTQITENTGKQDDKNAVIVSDKDETVKWSFANGDMPENFTPEAKIEITADKDIKVDFLYSGKLPEGTTVTIQLPKEENEYKERTKLYFYYYNPDTLGYEYVSEGMAQNGEVTFEIKHCSEYLITLEKLVEADVVEKEPDLLPIIVAGMVLLVGAGAVTYIVIKKNSLKKI